MPAMAILGWKRNTLFSLTLETRLYTINLMIYRSSIDVEEKSTDLITIWQVFETVYLYFIGSLVEATDL